MKSNGFVTIASADRSTPFVEAYGLLLASVLLGSNGKPPGIVAVASAQAGDGCSTTTLNLAMMMARTGRPTLVIDANMRKPEMHKGFGVPQSPGLADMLTRKADLKQVLVPSKMANLSVIPAGNTDVPAQALLSYVALAEILKAAREQFELIVIDTPPILDYPDALHVCKVVDGVLLVVSTNGASRRDQQEARRLLERVEARILGTVLNRVRMRAMARI